MADALGGKVKYVCTACGSDDISFDGEARWLANLQCMHLERAERVWCHVCDDSTGEECVPIDWVKPDDWGADER